MRNNNCLMGFWAQWIKFSKNAVILIAFILSMGCAVTVEAEPYDPDFWLWHYDQSHISMSEAVSYGFDGVVIYGATQNGTKMTYSFPSPTLSSEGWANYDWNRVGTRATEAHDNGLKLMVNMEGINPWGWVAGRDYYNPSLLRGVVTDLKATGADRWFDECFDLWSDWGFAVADQCSVEGMGCMMGTDPMHLYQVAWLQQGTPTDYPSHYSHASVGSMYCYRLIRDVYYESAHLAQHGALAYGFSETWNMPKAMVYTIGKNWGIDPGVWPGVFRGCALIEALQFRMDEFFMLHVWYDSNAQSLDIPGLKTWMNSYVQKQESGESRPVLNIVVHLEVPSDKHNWMGLVAEADAITWGAFQAGYNVQCSTEPLPDADAYYVVTRGNEWDSGTLDLTTDLVALFSGDKPVFMQCLYGMPYGDVATSRWKTAMAACGVCVTTGGISYADMPATGVFDGKTFNFTGYDTRNKWWRTQVGTRLPSDAVMASEICAQAPDGTPLIVGRNRKYFIAGACLSWQTGSVIARLLSGYGAAPDSDVWGIAGSAVTAVMATNDTQLCIDLPDVGDGSLIHVMHYDPYHALEYEDTITYTAPYTRAMNRYDVVVMDTVSLVSPASEPVIPGSGDSGGAPVCPLNWPESLCAMPSVSRIPVGLVFISFVIINPKRRG